MLTLDHLVVAARTLEEGASWVEERLGVAPAPGGRHALMGTHNRLLSLGAGRYLEVIAVDPASPAPSRPRWFALDAPGMRARLASGPALVHWVARTDRLEEAVAATPGKRPEVLSLSRGELRWRIGVPEDGSLPEGGPFPTFIEWEGERHPSGGLAGSGCALERLELRHPRATALLAVLRGLGLGAGEAVTASDGAAVALVARIDTARGACSLGD